MVLVERVWTAAVVTIHQGSAWRFTQNRKLVVEPLQSKGRVCLPALTYGRWKESFFLFAFSRTARKEITYRFYPTASDHESLHNVSELIWLSCSKSNHSPSRFSFYLISSFTTSGWKNERREQTVARSTTVATNSRSWLSLNWCECRGRKAPTNIV